MITKEKKIQNLPETAFPISLFERLSSIRKPWTSTDSHQNESGHVADARLKQEVSQPGCIPGDPSWELDPARKQIEVPHRVSATE